MVGVSTRHRVVSDEPLHFSILLVAVVVPGVLGGIGFVSPPRTEKKIAAFSRNREYVGGGGKSCL